MSDFEHQEYFQYHQQRFEAALKFTLDAIDGGYPVDGAIETGIECADKLITRLEETRTKT